MNALPEFSRLVELDIRDAWRLEAYEFTPWLADNLEYLSDALGVCLELIKREAPVGPFSADLLLRNASDKSLILVENQLEASDHSHLGQILTYLQGLEAKTVVWIAPRFRDEHLSAVRWLNQNTLSEYAFFAIQLKAVRIGDSPIAPVLEVLERPNEWERAVHRAAQAEISEQGQLRQEFWRHYLALFPTEEAFGPPNAANSRWHSLRESNLIISQFLSDTRLGLFVRGLRNAESEEVFNRLRPHKDVLEGKTSSQLVPSKDGRFLLLERNEILADRSKWDDLARWLNGTTQLYEQVLKDLFATSTIAESNHQPINTPGYSHGQEEAQQ
ncbi:MAG: hypothetical protein ACK6DC_11220 [Planctomycetota bacterium]|jgi:hypothetical protein